MYMKRYSSLLCWPSVFVSFPQAPYTHAMLESHECIVVPHPAASLCKTVKRSGFCLFPLLHFQRILDVEANQTEAVVLASCEVTDADAAVGRVVGFIAVSYPNVVYPFEMVCSDLAHPCWFSCGVSTF